MSDQTPVLMASRDYPIQAGYWVNARRYESVCAERDELRSERQREHDMRCKLAGDVEVLSGLLKEVLETCEPMHTQFPFGRCCAQHETLSRIRAALGERAGRRTMTTQADIDGDEIAALGCQLGDARADVERLRERLTETEAQRDKWLARALALFWSGHADDVSVESIRRAADAIDAMLKKEGGDE